jgi:hypothetical protein
VKGLMNAGRSLVKDKMLTLKKLSTSGDVGTFVTVEGPILTWKNGGKPNWSGDNLHVLDKSYREDQRRRRAFVSATPEKPSVVVVLASPNQYSNVLKDFRMRGVDPVFVEYGVGWLAAFDFESK